MKSRALAPWLIVALVSPWLGACGRCSNSGSEEPIDERACASACAALVSAGCGRTGLEPADAARCALACRALPSQGCEAERRAYLGCVSTARIDCERALCAAAVCIEHRTGIVGCDVEHAAYQRCIAPCLHAGAEHVSQRTLSIAGRDRRVQAETVRVGCAACPETLRKGATPGSMCQSPKVCAERCCTCPNARVRYSTRVCADASCAGDDACDLARRLGPDPCSARP